jgi:hypothetical protein
MRSNTTIEIHTHFHLRKKPREATPFTRLRGFLVFGFAIFAMRPRWRPQRNLLSSGIRNLANVSPISLKDQRRPRPADDEINRLTPIFVRGGF